MISGDDPPDHPDQRRKHLPPSGGPPRQKYPDDNIYYKKWRRPNAKPEIRVPLELWDEWEAFRVLLHDGADSTHATVIEWLLKTMRDTADGLRRTIIAAEAARGSVEELPSPAEHRGPSTSETETIDLNTVPNESFIDVLDFFTDPPQSENNRTSGSLATNQVHPPIEEIPDYDNHTNQFDPEDWTFLEEVRESYAYDEQELRIFSGIDVHEMEALGLEVCTPK
ncbi:unnamed protein product [Calypogeia fissa]